ncbi:hypothetical protein NPIL_199131 [Nephila pilipes]|uniref:Uncharacterized protein n=1 Tax=Nephila pilipes TaxID=299642 RepID=A0A8X6R0G7_NEPPI|nr:hypothetical protein NPIL_199131 [Nephila pilipes]
MEAGRVGKPFLLTTGKRHKELIEVSGKSDNPDSRFGAQIRLAPTPSPGRPGLKNRMASLGEDQVQSRDEQVVAINSLWVSVFHFFARLTTLQFTF